MSILKRDPYFVRQQNLRAKLSQNNNNGGNSWLGTAGAVGGIGALGAGGFYGARYYNNNPEFQGKVRDFFGWEQPSQQPAQTTTRTPPTTQTTAPSQSATPTQPTTQSATPSSAGTSPTQTAARAAPQRPLALPMPEHVRANMDAASYYDWQNQTFTDPRRRQLQTQLRAMEAELQKELEKNISLRNAVNGASSADAGPKNAFRISNARIRKLSVSLNLGVSQLQAGPGVRFVDPSSPARPEAPATRAAGSTTPPPTQTPTAPVDTGAWRQASFSDPRLNRVRQRVLRVEEQFSMERARRVDIVESLNRTTNQSQRAELLRTLKETDLRMHQMNQSRNKGIATLNRSLPAAANVPAASGSAAKGVGSASKGVGSSLRNAAKRVIRAAV